MKRTALRILIAAFILASMMSCALFRTQTYEQAQATQNADWAIAAAQTQSANQTTLVAAQVGQMQAESTAIINESSDSPQGGVNIYLQGHQDGYEEGVEDVTTTNTIQKQDTQIGILLYAVLGIFALLAILGILHVLGILK